MSGRDRPESASNTSGCTSRIQTHPRICRVIRSVCCIAGLAWDEKRSARELLLTAHERYVDRLHGLGKLGAAGAVEAPDDLLGLMIFKPIPIEEAQRLLGDDPAVQAGVLRVDFHAWWSSDHVLPW